MKDGRRFGRPPNPRQPPRVPEGKVNVTDPDSKLVHGMRGWIQGYNAQAVCNERHLIVAAEVMTASPDFGHLGPMVTAARACRSERQAIRSRPPTLRKTVLGREPTYQRTLPIGWTTSRRPLMSETPTPRTPARPGGQ
jgi:hypothetical protein